MEESLDAAEFARLAEEMFAAAGATETAEQIVGLARAELDVDHAGVTMIRSGGRLETVAATDPFVEQAAALHGEIGSGPYLDDSWRDQTLLSSDLGRERRWPEWAAKVAALGAGSLLAVEMISDNRRVGVLALFGWRPRAFNLNDVAFAHIFARHAALALVAAEHDAGLAMALDGRKLIGQAQGILMERYGLDDAQAFEVLKRYSQQHNLKLRQIAADLVATRCLPADQGGSRQ